MNKGEPLDPSHHILRYIGGLHIEKNDSDGTAVILGTGFLSRPNEDNKPSCNWLEQFPEPLNEQVSNIRSLARIKLGATAKLVKLNVGEIKTTILTRTDHHRAVEVISDPLLEDTAAPFAADPSHALITNIPSSDDPQGVLVGDLMVECIQQVFPARA